MEFEPLRNKFRGTLLGGAIGDAIGAPFFGRHLVPRSTFDNYIADPGRMHYTDDTQLTIAVAESLVDARGFVGEDLAEKLVRHVQEEPWRAYAERPARIVQQLAQGTKWQDAAGQVPTLGGDLTPQGAANRIAPAALLHYLDASKAMTLALEIAAVFGPGWPRDLSALHAAALALLLREKPGALLDKARFFHELRTHVNDPAAIAGLDALRSLLPDSAPEQVHETLRRLVPQPHDALLGLYAFLRCPESFSEAVLYGITFGGPTDTIGALAGSLSGAFLGADLIPPVWRREVEGAPLMRRLADSLLLLAKSPA